MFEQIRLYLQGVCKFVVRVSRLEFLKDILNVHWLTLLGQYVVQLLSDINVVLGQI